MFKLNEFDDIFNAFDDCFNYRGLETYNKKVNVIETDNGYILEVEIGGFTKDEISITVKGNELTIDGKRKGEKCKKGKYLIREFKGAKNFQRVVKLGSTINSDGIDAKIDNGILTITLPTKEKKTLEGRTVKIK